MTRTAVVVAACAIAALSASCSATPPATGPAPITSPVPTTATASTTPTATTASARPTDATGVFTVSGDNPVTPNGSQDTYAATPNATCDSVQRKADEAVGGTVADGFSLENFPAAADLLTHFLAGKGTEVDYRLGSAISKEARASTGFEAVNAIVQGEIALQLKAGDTRVQLTAARLPTVLFADKASDLYWGFRGTQGLTVSGSGRREDGGYVGTLTYVIRDSYGFPVDDTLDGFGPPMRYLQTVCGAPRHPGGAHWFPDTITVSVPYNPAS